MEYLNFSDSRLTYDKENDAVHFEFDLVEGLTIYNTYTPYARHFTWKTKDFIALMKKEGRGVV